MAFSKAPDFKADEIILSKYAKALSHPARISILKLLMTNELCCYCGNITQKLPISQSTVSQHLKELKNAGLIKGEITPPKIKYCIDKEGYELARKYFSIFFE